VVVGVSPRRDRAVNPLRRWRVVTASLAFDGVSMADLLSRPLYPNQEIDMSRKVLTVVAAAAVALFAQGVYAQASAPASRADVKAETKAAEKSGKLTPAGEGPGAMTSGEKGATSTKTKAEQKSETKAAAKSKQLTPAGEGPGNMTSGEKGATSTKTKADQKAETKAAAKSKQLTPAGEAANPAAEGQKK